MWGDVQVGVLMLRRARGVLWSLDSGVRGFVILREYCGRRGRGITALLFRVKRGLVPSPYTGVTVGLGCAVPGSAGDRGPPLAGCGGVVVWAFGPVPMCRCGSLVPLR